MNSQSTSLKDVEQDLSVPLIGGELNASRISSDVLLSDKGRLEIVHENEIYRLTRTKNGKLILTK